MDEIIVRVARTIACLARLRILSCLAIGDEETPSGLAERLGMPLGVVSAHLGRLSSAGLLRRRHGGAWCYCRAQSAYPDKTLSGRLIAWLRTTLSSPMRALENYGVRELRNLSPDQAEAELHQIIFEAVTAFTNLRRLQILRHLMQGAESTAETLMSELSMSDAAVSRHTSKLLRRCYVVSDSSDRRLTYRLASAFKTPVHAKMFEIVSSEWMKK